MSPEKNNWFNTFPMVMDDWLSTVLSLSENTNTASSRVSSAISFLLTFIKLKNYSLTIVKKECLYVFKILLFTITSILFSELMGVQMVENNILRLGIKLIIISLSFFSGLMVFFPEIKFIVKGIIKNDR